MIQVSTFSGVDVAKKQCPERWSQIDRPRRWQAIRCGQTVILRNHAVDLVAGEDEYPPTYELTWDEWVADHEAVYGMDITGSHLEAAAKRRDDWDKIRRMADGDTKCTDENIREVIAAFHRILRGLTNETTES